MSAVGIDIVSVHKLFAYRVVSTVSTDIVSSHMKYSESESELFTGDTSKDNHSPGPVFREVSP